MSHLIGNKTRAYLKHLGLPNSDPGDLPESPLRFSDGSRCRIEQGGADTPRIIERLITGAEALDFVVHRFVETRGIMRLSDADIREMARLCHDAGSELILSVGPRATYDLSAARRTPGGSTLGNRIRGMEGLIWAVEDVRRALDLGIRGIMVFDEGMLWLLDRMRSDGELQADFSIKVSAGFAAANPLSVKMLAQNGANTVNVARDLPLPMIAGIRQAVEIALDVHTDSPQASGGFVRTYEAPQFVQVGAPVYLKCGTNAARRDHPLLSEGDIDEMIEQTARVWDTLHRFVPHYSISALGTPDMMIPSI